MCVICYRNVHSFEWDITLYFNWKSCSKAWNSAQKHDLKHEAWIAYGKSKRKEEKRNFSVGLTNFILFVLVMLMSNTSGPHSSFWIPRRAILTTTRLQMNTNCTPFTHNAVSLLTLTDSVQCNWYHISQTQTHTICKMYKRKDTTAVSQGQSIEMIILYNKIRTKYHEVLYHHYYMFITMLLHPSLAANI